MADDKVTYDELNKQLNEWVKKMFDPFPAKEETKNKSTEWYYKTSPTPSKCKYAKKQFVDRLPLSSLGDKEKNREDTKIKIHQKASRCVGREWPYCKEDGTVLIEMMYEYDSSSIAGYLYCPHCFRG